MKDMKTENESSLDLNKIYQVAIAAAYHSGQVLNKYFGLLKQVKKKGAIDLVTEADLESEKVVKDDYPKSISRSWNRCYIHFTLLLVAR
jgi:Archaeal fructose-1,6-bisphosphatase and related enzymes of inositol monophosphatase family